MFLIKIKFSPHPMPVSRTLNFKKIFVVYALAPNAKLMSFLSKIFFRFPLKYVDKSTFSKYAKTFSSKKFDF